MKPFRSSRYAKTAVPIFLAGALTMSVGATMAGAQQAGHAVDYPGGPEYDPPGDFEPPQPLEASVQLIATTSDWSWPGVYDSAFRIDYTVTNTGDVRLTEFRIAEENANAIVHDCYNYNQPIEPGESVSCSALLYQTTNPQTVRSIVYSRSKISTGWVSDRSRTTYTRQGLVDRPFGGDFELDVAVTDVGGAALPR